MGEPALFWTDDGWLVDLRSYRIYPGYGEWDWVSRTNNTGLEPDGDGLARLSD